MGIEEEAKRLTKVKQEKFYDELVTLLLPAKRHIESHLYDSRLRERALERLDDVAIIARFAAELFKLK